MPDPRQGPSRFTAGMADIGTPPPFVGPAHLTQGGYELRDIPDQVATVVAPFQAHDKDTTCLSLEAGEDVTVTMESKDGQWVLVQDKKGREGMVPKLSLADFRPKPKQTEAERRQVNSEMENLKASVLNEVSRHVRTDIAQRAAELERREQALATRQAEMERRQREVERKQEQIEEKQKRELSLRHDLEKQQREMHLSLRSDVEQRQRTLQEQLSFQAAQARHDRDLKLALASGPSQRDIRQEEDETDHIWGVYRVEADHLVYVTLSKAGPDLRQDYGQVPFTARFWDGDAEWFKHGIVVLQTRRNSRRLLAEVRIDPNGRGGPETVGHLADEFDGPRRTISVRFGASEDDDDDEGDRGTTWVRDVDPLAEVWGLYELTDLLNATLTEVGDPEKRLSYDKGKHEATADFKASFSDGTVEWRGQVVVYPGLPQYIDGRMVRGRIRRFVGGEGLVVEVPQEGEHAEGRTMIEWQSDVKPLDEIGTARHGKNIAEDGEIWTKIMSGEEEDILLEEDLNSAFLLTKVFYRRIAIYPVLGDTNTRNVLMMLCWTTTILEFVIADMMLELAEWQVVSPHRWQLNVAKYISFALFGVLAASNLTAVINYFLIAWLAILRDKVDPDDNRHFWNRNRQRVAMLVLFVLHGLACLFLMVANFAGIMEQDSVLHVFRTLVSSSFLLEWPKLLFLAVKKGTLGSGLRKTAVSVENETGFKVTIFKGAVTDFLERVLRVLVVGMTQLSLVGFTFFLIYDLDLRP